MNKTEELREVRDQLNSLLAIIHRDGGHYAMEHGTRKAVAEAIRLSIERLP